MPDQLNANLGDDAGAVVAGANNNQAVTTTTTTTTATQDGPRLEASPQIYLGNQGIDGPFAAIMLALTQQNSVLNGQNNVLSRLEGKFDSHITAVDTRFKALEKVTNTVEIAISTIQEKLRIMDRTNAELEHAAALRREQNRELEAQISEIRRQQVEFNRQLETILRTATTTQAGMVANAQAQQVAQEQARRPDNHSRLMFSLFILALVAITALNIYLMMSTGK